MRRILSFAILASNMAFAESKYDFIYNEVHKLETHEAQEQETTENVITKQIKEQILLNRDANTVRRGAHAKAHGCVVGKLKIENSALPAELKVGFFAKNATYKTWTRFSNGNGQVQNDKIPDGRGMAVQVVGVEGEKSLPKNVEEDEFKLQDFIMINHPQFFIKNTADYDKFFQGVGKFFRLHPYELTIALRTAAHLVTNPLKSQYFSMVPYALGSESAYKFSMAPEICEDSKGLSSAWSYTGSNLMRQNMQDSLLKDKACFKFYMQKFISEAATPVEDPRINWSTFSNPIPVGNLEIKMQTFTAMDSSGKVFQNAQDDACENSTFTPWHSLKVNRPLGSINRTRGVIYGETSELRHKENKVKKQATHPVDRIFFKS